MLEGFETVTRHQNYLETRWGEIDIIAQAIVELQDQLAGKDQSLRKLVERYQQERYRRQEEIWKSRRLTRCTRCYDVPPGHEPDRWKNITPTIWGGWGLIPFEDAHYTIVSGHHWHTSHESDSYDSHSWFHRLCGNCYLDKLKDCAAGDENLHDLSIEKVEEIRLALVTEITSTSHFSEEGSVMRRKFKYSSDDIKVFWYQLPIPEKAYEIGKNISIDFQGNLKKS